MTRKYRCRLYFFGGGQDVVAIGFKVDELETYFEDVRVAGHHDDPFARADERDLDIFVCRTPRMPLADAWSNLKRYR